MASLDHSAVLREPSAPSAPGLDSRRFAIQVARSNKKLVDEEIPLTTLNEKLASAINAVRRMPQFSELVVTCAICLVLLGGMALCSLYWFDERRAIASRWARLLESSGFVDYPQLVDPSSVSAICAAMPIIVGICSLVVVPWSLLTRRASGIKLFMYALIVVMITCFIQAVLAQSNRFQGTIDGKTVESLASQTGGVANFNRGFCQAWCRQSEAGLAALMRGDCGPKEMTEFDGVLAMFDAKDWCLQAIAHQKFELVAEYSGVSPFAGLKGDGGRALTNMHPDMASYVYPLLFLMVASVYLAVYSEDPFNEKSRYRR